MKKTMIALATLAAVSGTAFAQSTVTIGGTLEIAPISNGKVTTQSAAGAASINEKTSRTSGPNTWSTSILNISGTEDLGGGLKASFVLISGAGASTATGASAADSGIGNRERSLALAGGFGTVRLGRFVPAAAAGFHAFSGSGSATLVGSIYGMSTPNATAARNGLHTSDANFERINNVLQYTSPTMSGFSVNVAVANDSSDSSDPALTGKNDGKQTSIHLGYAAGPLSAGIGINSRTNKTETTSTAAFSSTDADLQWIGASYNLGVATLFATNVTREAKKSTGGAAAVTGTDASVNSFGVSVPMGALTLRASAYSGKDNRGTGNADDMKLSGNQLSAAYALSKRTSIIAATGTNQIKRNGAAAAAQEARKVTGTTIAVNHTF
jgi:predicted porin